MTTPAKRPSMNFDMVGLRVGDTLEIDGHLDQTAIVVSTERPRVLFRGKEMSPKAAAGEFYQHESYRTFDAWCYNGERLNDRRKRFEDWHRPRN